MSVHSSPVWPVKASISPRLDRRSIGPGVSVAHATRAQPAVAGFLGAHLQGRYNPVPRAEGEEEDEDETAVCDGKGAPGEGESEEGWDGMGCDGEALLLLHCLCLSLRLPRFTPC